MKILVIYSHYSSGYYHKNLKFFQDFGMYRQHDVDYILSVNGSEVYVDKSDRWSRILYRENRGYDFGAWQEALQDTEIFSYDYFIFMNDTIRGPFGDRHWIQTFCDLINEKTKLVGITINCHTGIYLSYFQGEDISVPHVQSMLWCTDRIGLDIVKETLRLKGLKKTEVVIHQEIGLSQRILSAGYNIGCILKSYDADYTKGNIAINTKYAGGDPWYKGTYFGRSLHPYETIFFKTNRGINEEELERCTEIQYSNIWY